MAIASDPIKIDGWDRLRKSLRQLDKAAPKELRLVQNEAAGLVVAWARPKVPSKSGKAARSVRATSTQGQAKVSGGGARVPYYGWLDFGGRVGPKRSIHRPFLSSGRFIYPGYYANRQQVADRLADGLVELVERLGIEVGSGGQ